MSYTQIKNLLVPPSKRTASKAATWLGKMPSLPVWPKLVAQIGLAIITTNITAILVSGLFLPGVVITWAMLVAAIVVFLSAYQLYESREAIARSMVMILANM